MKLKKKLKKGKLVFHPHGTTVAQNHPPPLPSPYKFVADSSQMMWTSRLKCNLKSPSQCQNNQNDIFVVHTITWLLRWIKWDIRSYVNIFPLSPIPHRHWPGGQLPRLLGVKGYANFVLLKMQYPPLHMIHHR